MPRLVAFGCSYSYGHGLPDCIDESDVLQPGPEPSKFAWPQLLADKLGYKCLNLSSPGAGNFEILMRVLETEFYQDDLVILGFSYFTRYDFYRIIDYQGAGEKIKYETADHRAQILSTVGKLFYEEKVYWNNWLAIQHIELLLNSQGIKNFSFLHIPFGARVDKPKLLKLENFIPDIKFIKTDSALDKAHPGLESNRLQSEEIYSRINL